MAPDSASKSTLIDTPLGAMMAYATESGVSRLDFSQKDHLTGSVHTTTNNEHLEQLAAELVSYFRGTLRSFATPIAPVGTEFQLRVWQLLLDISYGTTTTYGRLARQLGDPNAVRAVARANALNPIAIIVPCHRVIGSDNSLTGYAGGLWRKRRLLQLEATGSIEETQTTLF